MGNISINMINFILLVLVVFIVSFVVSCQGIDNFLTPIDFSLNTPIFERKPITISPSNVRVLTPHIIAQATLCNKKYNKNNFIKNRGSPSSSLTSPSIYDVHIERNIFEKIDEFKFDDSQDRKFASVGERLTCKIFEEYMFNNGHKRKATLHLRPNFLKNPKTKHNLEIDIFDNMLQIGIEYNGKQHYECDNFMTRTNEQLNYQLYKDNFKLERCKELGIHLIVVPYTVDNVTYVDGKKKYKKLSENEKEMRLRRYIIPQLDKIFNNSRECSIASN